eukprot:Opistho-1_new@12515
MVVPTIPGGRVDVIEIKNRLNGVLGDHSATYWESLRSFTKARLSKGELDRRAKECLGDGNVSLHNEFIRAILVNAQSTQPPPEDKENARRSNKRKFSTLKDGRSLDAPSKAPRLFPGAASAHFSREFRSHLPRAEAPPARGPRGPQSALAVSTALIAAAATVRAPPGDVEPELCAHALALPDAATLRARCFLSAFEAGLDDVEEGVAEVVQQALELHLKNILSAVLAARRTQGTFGSMAFVDPQLPASSATDSLPRHAMYYLSPAALAVSGERVLARRPHSLHLEDLSLALELHPSLLNGDTASAERLRARLTMPPAIFADAEAMAKVARMHQQRAAAEERALRAAAPPAEAKPQQSNEQTTPQKADGPTASRTHASPTVRDVAMKEEPQ